MKTKTMVPSETLTMARKVHEFFASFFFRPARTEPIEIVRIGVALLLLVQSASLASYFFDFYSGKGMLQHGAFSPNRSAFVSYTHWVRLFSTLGISERFSLLTLGGSYIVSLILLCVGWKTQFAAVSAWLFHLMLSQEPTTYGLDQYAHQSLFLLIWSPVGQSLSLDAKLSKLPNAPTWHARLSLRTFQIWFAIAYLSSGFSKSLGAQWWDGEAIWRSVMLPTFRHFNLDWLSQFPWVAMVAARGTLVIEGAYPLFIWPAFTRKWWVTATVLLHLSIAIFMGLWLFAAIMILLNIALFGVSPEPVISNASKPKPK